MNLLKKFQNSEKYTKYSAIIVIIFSIIVLSLTSIYHVSGDGCWHVSASRFMAENKKIPLFEPIGRDEPFYSPPLYHFLAASIYIIFNTISHDIANFAVKLISPIFGILSLTLSFLLIKKLTNPKIAFYSAVFLAFIPIFIDYSVLSYVESMLVFFVVLSVYFLINGRIALSGIAAGLSILTKYNGAFILPVLIYIVYRKSGKSKRLFYRNSLIVIALSLLVASPWLVRNWILLGNPIWPFLNFIFDGYESKSFYALNLKNLVELKLWIFTFLGFFGVPDGNPAAFKFASSIPYMPMLLTVWLIGAALFFIPLIFGFSKASKNFNEKYTKSFLILWIISYLAVFSLYAANAGFSVSRIILPLFPAIAVFWAFGYEKVLSYDNFGKLAAFATCLIIIGLTSALFVKFHGASRLWDLYEKDFEWVRANTNPDAVFIANGQCVPYNIERTSLYAVNDNFYKAGYAWVNQRFILDERSIYDEKTLNLVQSRKNRAVYSNIETGTVVYKITH